MNIIISGLTCSGKTTFSNEILNQFKDVCIFREDDYMKDITSIPHKGNYYLMDLPVSYNLDEYIKDVNTLLTNKKVNYPEYNFYINKRINKEKIIKVSEVNVFEGLHTIDALKELKNSIKVFMDTDIDTCLKRRIYRDTTLYKINEESIRNYFNEIIIPIYKTHIEYQKELADIVIREEGDKKCLLKKLQTYF